VGDILQKTDVAAAYDSWSRTYDCDPNKTREAAATALRKARLELTGRQVIEIGCGTGYNTEWLAKRAAGIVALDFSTGMLRQASARVPASHVRFIEHDIRFAWPVPDASAELVVIMLVLEHIEKIGAVLQEAARVLQSEGEVFLCELHPTRQLLGGQAQFTDSNTGERVRVSAYLHDVSEFLNSALSTGFELLYMGEPRDQHAQANDLPRLLTLHLRLHDRKN